MTVRTQLTESVNCKTATVGLVLNGGFLRFRGLPQALLKQTILSPI